MSLILLPAMCVIELMLLFLTLVVGLIRPKWGLRLAHWSMRTLPSRGWYVSGGDK